MLEIGRIEPERQVELKSKLSGVVKSVGVDAGDRVASGQLLMTLDAVDYQREVARTRAELSRAKSGLGLALSRAARAELGAGQGVVPRAEAESSAFDADEKKWLVASAQVALATANARVRETRLVAPMAGTVVRREVNPGETVVPGIQATLDGKPLLVIADLSRLLVKVDLNQIDVAKLAPGMSVSVRVDALPDKSYSARVTRIAPASVRRPGKDVDVFPVEALIADADERIKPGMTAEVRVHVERKADVVALPIEAVRKASGKSVVTRVLAGASGPKREEIEVTLGARNDREVEVRQGVSVGDRILLEPPSSAREETKI